MRAVQPSFHLIVALKLPDVSARFAEPPGHVLRIFGIEFARLGDERLDRLARFGVDDFADTSTDCGSAAGRSFFVPTGGWD